VAGSWELEGTSPRLFCCSGPPGINGNHGENVSLAVASLFELIAAEACPIGVFETRLSGVTVFGDRFP